jgi:hypothetical protein
MPGLTPSVTQVPAISSLLAPEVAEILRAEAFSALKSLPRRGAEIGGFLTAAADEVCASGVELVPSEYRYGPSYRLSPSDIDLLRERVESCAESGGRRIVGYFRSCTRKEFQVEPEDLAAVREALPKASFIFLVKAEQSGNAIVRAFSYANGEASTCEGEFEVRMNYSAPRELAEATPARVEHHVERHVEQSFENSFEQNRVQAPRASDRTGEKAWPPRKNKFAWIKYAVPGALVFAVLAWAYLHQRVAAPATDLGMRVETQANSFRVTWNRNLPALRSATAGTLRIDDGRGSRDLQLDQSQIATGSLVYVSDSKDITFRLQVEGERGRQFTERVRVLTGDQPAAKETAKVASKDAPKESDAVVPPGQIEAGISREAPAAGNQRGLVTPTVRAWPSGPPRAGAYRAAHPLKQTTPKIPAFLISSAAVIEIEVRINEKGRVIEAHEIDSDPTVGSELHARAIEASRQWTFEPAKSRGRSVTSNFKIVYRFVR